MMPLVACIEFRSLRVKDFAKRCYSLSWGSGHSLGLLVFTHGLGMVISYVISLVIAAVLGRLFSVSFNTITLATIYIAIIFGVYSIPLIAILWSPFYLLTLGTFYIDVRIRKEALDLEYQLSHSDRI